MCKIFEKDKKYLLNLISYRFKSDQDYYSPCIKVFIVFVIYIQLIN